MKLPKTRSSGRSRASSRRATCVPSSRRAAATSGSGSPTPSRVGTPVTRDGRHDDLALVSVELLGVGAVARIEELEARIVGRRHGGTVPQGCSARNRDPAAGVGTTCGASDWSSPLALCCAALGAAGSSAATARCKPTLPGRMALPSSSPAAGFNYGTAGLRVQLGWPNGTLAAGILPDGGSRATVEEDGSIHAKLGWWRGVPGALRITGRRLDAAAPPLRGPHPGGLRTDGASSPPASCSRRSAAGGSSAGWATRG